RQDERGTVMSGSKSQGPSLVPSVAYVRRSAEKQEASLPEQRKAIERFATEKGYAIRRWYEDDAISGDNTRKRAGFLQMLADAQQFGDFEAILCWDQARFGRFLPQRGVLDAGRDLQAVQPAEPDGPAGQAFAVQDEPKLSTLHARFQRRRRAALGGQGQGFQH